MKKIALALAAMGLAAVFTACGDDSSSSGGKIISCDMKTEFEFMGESLTSHSCAEISSNADAADELEKSCVGAPDFGITATKGSGCAGGEKKKCASPDGSGAVYFYDADAADSSCDDLLGGED